MLKLKVFIQRNTGGHNFCTILQHFRGLWTQSTLETCVGYLIFIHFATRLLTHNHASAVLGCPSLPHGGWPGGGCTSRLLLNPHPIARFLPKIAPGPPVLPKGVHLHRKSLWLCRCSLPMGVTAVFGLLGLTRSNQSYTGGTVGQIISIK